MNLFKPDIKRLTEKKNVPGLIKAAEWGLRHRDIKICLKAVAILGYLGDSRAVNPLLQMGEEAVFYFPEQCHQITAVVFIAIGKIRSPQSYIPLVRLFSRLQTRPSTHISNQSDDERYAAFIFAIQSINHNEDRNLADVLFFEILQPKEIVSEKKDNEADSRETRKAALEVLSVIGEEEDIMRLEQLVEAANFESRDKDMGNAYKETIAKIKRRLPAKN